MQAEIQLPRKALAIPAATVWLAVFGIGLAGVIIRLLDGHKLAGYTSSIPWGLWVATYIYFVGLSAGAFLISALIYVFGMKRLEPIGKLALFTALVSLIAALLSIWMDLGHQWRFYEVFTRGNPRSMMAWMVWLYTAYSVVLCAELWFAMRADLVAWSCEASLRGRIASLLLGRPGEAIGPRVALPPRAYDRSSDLRKLQVLGAIGVPLAIAFHGGVGALFGVVGARPFWNAAIYPLMFVVGALASGGGLLTAIVAFFWPEKGSSEHKEIVSLLSRITLGLLAVYLIMLWAEYSITWYADIPAASRPLNDIVGGPYPWVFWVFQVALGAVVPIAILLLKPRSVTWAGVATFLIAACFLATRINIVIPGLTEPQLAGLETAYVEPRLAYDYAPTVFEWSVFLFVGAVAGGLFFAGYHGLPLVNRSKETSR